MGRIISRAQTHLAGLHVVTKHVSCPHRRGRVVRRGAAGIGEALRAATNVIDEAVVAAGEARPAIGIRAADGTAERAGQLADEEEVASAQVRGARTRAAHAVVVTASVVCPVGGVADGSAAVD